MLNFIDNPSLNDVTLNVDARISVPAEPRIRAGFCSDRCCSGSMEHFPVPPEAPEQSHHIKGEKVGTFTVHFSGLYWPGDNKDDYNPISLSHPFIVEQASKNPGEAPSFEESNPEVVSSSEENGGIKAEGEGSISAPGFGILIAAIGLRSLCCQEEVSQVKV